MKKNFKPYALIWAVLLIVFNLVVFIAKPLIPGYEFNYDARFWIAWVFIIAAFAGNLVCAFYAFKAENLRKMFYNLPLITISWTALIATMVAGCVLMLIPDSPAWIAAIICILTLGFSAIAVIKAGWAAEKVAEIDEKVKDQTSFIRNMTAASESLMASAGSDEVKAECKKLYETLKYSDPVSNPGVTAIEEQIDSAFGELKTAVNGDNEVTIQKIRSIVDLINERNQLTKRMK